MARLAGERPRFRFQFSVLTLLGLATILGPILGWYGPIAATTVRSWLAEEGPAAGTKILIPPRPMTKVPIKPAPMIGPIPLGVEQGMQADALERRASRRTK